jgi:hypothetical protein
MSEVVGRYGSAKRIRHIATFPDELMHVIFSKLEFKDRITSGFVCKQWEKMLKAGKDTPRHWVVDYNVDSCVSSRGCRGRTVLYEDKQTIKSFERYVTVHTHPPTGLTDLYKCADLYKCLTSQVIAYYLLGGPLALRTRLTFYRGEE